MLFRSHTPLPALRSACRSLDQLRVAARQGRRLLRGYLTVDRFASRGSELNFDPDGTYSYENIHLGDHVSLGLRPVLMATRSTIRIGSHVMLGPEVMIIAGNHRVDIVGTFMDNVHDGLKRPEDDIGVVIEDDVWIGARVVVLDGVTIGRGSIIGAGAVVTKPIPPYSIAVGVPARVVRRRFDADQIQTHETRLRPS